MISNISISLGVNTATKPNIVKIAHDTGAEINPANADRIHSDLSFFVNPLDHHGVLGMFLVFLNPGLVPCSHLADKPFQPGSQCHTRPRQLTNTKWRTEGN